VRVVCPAGVLPALKARGRISNMNDQSDTSIPFVKLALERKLLTEEQLDLCRNLAKKSRKIGLEAR